MSFKSTMTGAAITVVALGAMGASIANAQPITGSIGLSVNGSISTSPPNDLFSTVASLGSIAFTTLVFNGSSTPDLSLIPGGTAITTNPTLELSGPGALGALGSFELDSADGNFVSAASVTVGGPTFFPTIIGTSGTATNETAQFYLVGEFDPAGTTGAFADNTASLTMSLTETCGGPCSPTNLGSFSMSATLAAPAAPPPPPSVPEPASLTLLGAGLIGLGVFRRRKG